MECDGKFSHFIVHTIVHKNFVTLWLITKFFSLFNIPCFISDRLVSILSITFKQDVYLSSCCRLICTSGHVVEIFKPLGATLGNARVKCCHLILTPLSRLTPREANGGGL